MKKILVPIDFSSDSINAFEHAIVIANKAKANIRLIHVQTNKRTELPLYFKDLVAKEKNSAAELFDILINKYKSKIKVTVDFKLRYGKVYKEITNQAKYDDSDLIVMGSHGISGFEAYWIGSNANKVISNSKCNVITIRNGFLRTNIKNIILPIDISKETRKKVDSAMLLAKIYNATIHVVTVRETNRAKVIEKLELYSKQVSEYLENKKIKFINKDLYGKNITDITIDYANEINAGLIAIMTEQIDSASNLWLGKYAQQMVNNSPVPVLSIHN